MIIRLKAFLVHFTGSLVLALVAIALVFFVWYPSPLDKAVGVTHIFFLVLGVDVILGPVLTFVVFNPAKKSLPYDLAVIVVLQLMAFGYGIWTVAAGRPAWLVFNVDRFDLVQAIDIDQRKLSEARPEYRTAPWTGPRWVAARGPATAEERTQLLFEATAGGADIAQRPNLYLRLQDDLVLIQKKSFSLDRLAEFNAKKDVDEVQHNWPQADAWLPLMSRVKPMVVLIRKDTADVVAVVDLNPWN